MNAVIIITLVLVIISLIATCITLKLFLDNKNKNNTADSVVSTQIKSIEENINNNYHFFEERLNEIRKEIDNKFDNKFKDLSDLNESKLKEIKQTVDEKLSETITKRFNESFDLLSKRLEEVQKSAGEMKRVGESVGNLQKILSNVKTTGIFGEIQLGAILEQILTRDQYETNIVTGTKRDPVEFAIKFPGMEENEHVYLPIDSKFPLEKYTQLNDAIQLGDESLINERRKALVTTIKNMAKDINEKYINIPKTTDIAIMFLPIEGLYAEVCKNGLIEELQNKYHVVIAGPTTMSAILTSFRMGFKTLALQKESANIWKTLAAIRVEFDRYNKLVINISDRFKKTNEDFDKLITTRTNKITNKLKKIETNNLSVKEADEILGLEEPKETPKEQPKERYKLELEDNSNGMEM